MGGRAMRPHGAIGLAFVNRNSTKKSPRKHELFGHSEEKLRAESRLLPIYRTHNK
jgi:hypothetical protein